MKKTIAISLIALLAFNLAGYRIMYYSIGQQHDMAVSTEIDNGRYNESELITISLPLSLPYLQDATAFERVDGEIELNGTVYKYVKRKISLGHLVLLCLRDTKKTELNDASKKLAEKQSSAKLVIKNILPDFTQQQLLFDFSINQFHAVPSGLFSHSSLPAVYCTVAEQPPEIV